MWFIFGIISTLAWGSADLFYKKGSDSRDSLSHLKIVVAVGFAMGIHGTVYMLVNDLTFDPFQLIWYLPVSSMYILSMTIGYVGLRYMELSIASPVQNGSGAITAILCYIFFPHQLLFVEVGGIVLVTGGILSLAFLEKKEEDLALQKEGKELDPKYQLSFMAIMFPILYCIIDGLGTFGDAVYLDEMKLISENDALLAFEYTFFICGIASLLYITVVKKQKINIWREKDKGIAAIFETTGQFFYVFAMAQNAIIIAPMVASYSIVSVILSRIFLKERLNNLHYVAVAVVMTGISMLGLSEAI
ncbi:MAG: EamA family transporter [Anaerovoracaceae bacterium]|jgi:uncharacterized membrane protein